MQVCNKTVSLGLAMESRVRDLILNIKFKIKQKIK